jgi:D-glycero-alpha-D-manno-heptose-7-phosphate kinase
LLLHFTKITRNADNILVQQKSNNKTEFLQKIANLVPMLEEAFLLNDFDNLGNLLQLNWDLKKELAEGISVPEIEEMTKIAKLNGAIGYKIAGAGGGGFLLSYVPTEKQVFFRKSMEDYRELPFMFDTFGSRIIFNIQ